MSVGFDDKIRFGSLDSLSYHSEQSLPSQPVGLGYSRTTDLLAVACSNEVSLFRQQQKLSGLSIPSSSPFSPTSASVWSDQEVAVGGSDNKTRVYRINPSDWSLSESAVIEGRHPITAVTFSPQGDLLAVGDSGRQVEVWSREEGNTWKAKIRGQWVYHTSRVTSLAWSPNGKLLASGSLDENIFIWSLEKPNEQFQLSYSHMGGVTGLEWVDDSNLVSVGNDHVINTWKIPSETL